MVKFAWSTEQSCADLLDDLTEGGVDAVEWKFFTWGDPQSGETLSVVAYVEGEDKFPDDWDDDKAKAEFFADIHREFRVAV